MISSSAVHKIDTSDWEMSVLYMPISCNILSNISLLLSYCLLLVKLCCVLVLALFTGIVSGLKVGGNFVLKTLHELAFLGEHIFTLPITCFYQRIKTKNDDV